MAVLLSTRFGAAKVLHQPWVTGLPRALVGRLFTVAPLFANYFAKGLSGEEQEFGCPHSREGCSPSHPWQGSGCRSAGPPPPRVALGLVLLAHHFVETETFKGRVTRPGRLSSGEIPASSACRDRLTLMGTGCCRNLEAGQTPPCQPGDSPQGSPQPAISSVPPEQLPSAGTEGPLDFGQITRVSVTAETRTGSSKMGPKRQTCSPCLLHGACARSCACLWPSPQEV